jgi:hypothetical protein
MNISQTEIDMMDKTEKAIGNEMRLLAAEGVSAPIILAGLTSAIAALLHTKRDPDAVARYFELQAAAAREPTGTQ